MNIVQSKNPAAQETLTGSDNVALLASIDTQDATAKANITQAKTASSPAVAGAIQRAKARALAVKRGSIASLANMAGASLDSTVESLENVDDDVMLERGERFVENARAFKKLLADFRDTRRAGQ